MQRDWSEIKQLLAASRDGSRHAREQLAALFGANHGSDQVAWHDAARVLLRADVEAELAALSAMSPAVAAMFDRTAIAFYSLDPIEELRRAAKAVADPKTRAIVEAHAKQLAHDPTIGPESIIPEDRLWVGDSECIGDASDYEEIVTDLMMLANIDDAKIECRDAASTRTLQISIGRRRYRAVLRGDTDYIDEPPLVACLNEILAAAKHRQRFYVVTDPRWGQECGIALATTAEAKRLRAASLLEEAEAE